jgi:hypothetical protein
MIEPRHRRIGTLAALIMAMASAHAATFDGNFTDSSNAALVGSDLGSASFTDENAEANNVALYTLTVPITETVSITSTSVAAGGADPYLTLFQGSGRSAAFFDSNYTQAFSTGGDLVYSGTLAKGTYELALGVFANLSFAENYGSGTLGDGFTGLGDPGSLGNGAYAVNVSLGSGTTLSAPEMDPACGVAGLILLAGALLVLRDRRAAPRTSVSSSA